MNIDSLIEKKRERKTLPIILYLLSFFIMVALIFLPYILKFGGSGLSNSTTVWAEYGDYISGATSFFNLLVFIILTVYVTQLGNSNNKKQLETQKKIILAQFRQAELTKLSELLNMPFDILVLKTKTTDSLLLLQHLSIKMHTLRSQMGGLFKCLHLEENILFVSNLIERINKLTEIIHSRTGKFNDLTEEQQIDFSKMLVDVIMMKDTLIIKLQSYIIEELEKSVE